MVLLLILLGCDEASGVAGARARARDFLDEHPGGTAMVRVGVDAPDFDAVVGTDWESTDLAEFFRICGGAPATDFDAELTVGPGTFPHPYVSQVAEGEVSDCVWERLASFPVDGPTGRDEQVLFVVRWRPEEAGEPTVVHQQAGSALPRGALAQAPPYYRHGRGVNWHATSLVDGALRFRFDEGAVVAGPLPDAEAWARHLTCAVPDRDLVRVSLVFDNGDLDEVGTVPPTSCVEERARAEGAWMSDQLLGVERVDDLSHAAVVLDVPVRPW